MSKVAAIILAAGRASRFGAQAGDSKIAARLDGKPLVRHVAEAALASSARPVIVVTGHAEEAARTALASLDVAFAHNAQAASGMASSLRCGLAATPPSCEAALVLLADMPRVQAATLDALIAAYEAATPRPAAVAPVYEGRRGNPVLLDRSLFAAVAAPGRGVGGAGRGKAAPVARAPNPLPRARGVHDVDTREALAAEQAQGAP